ncbi:hypothetical protein [Candidatus Roseilinea sp. NK_OTU-006]|jgi:peroxiredoxin|uniref:hypothetical protein n=1 Tax=Candidatus Roseilinea sp. NK_OTU-006 TaxID=2704250 RepID=UPI00145E6EA1|nr:hypothetical protein [Candidatus Roseilinea sp. NK_OTU-006]
MSERPAISPRLQVGAVAPNITLTKTTGERVTLAELLRQGRVLLVFLRHFG